MKITKSQTFRSESVRLLGGIAALVVLGTVSAAAATDAQIRAAIIRQSLASYPGNCPCPYNVDRAGRACGRRSAYSRPGGYAPICYDTDVTPAMIRAWRSGHGE